MHKTNKLWNDRLSTDTLKQVDALKVSIFSGDMNFKCAGIHILILNLEKMTI